MPATVHRCQLVVGGGVLAANGELVGTRAPLPGPGDVPMRVKLCMVSSNPRQFHGARDPPSRAEAAAAREAKGSDDLPEND